MRLSFARVNAYRRCPYQYRLAWVERLPPPERPYRKLANALHLALAAFHRAATSPDVALLLDLYRRAWSGPLTPFDRTQQPVGEAILRTYVERLGGALPRSVYVEAPFDVQLGPHVLFGRLDRVDETPTGLEIVDYKTAEGPAAGAPPPDTLQLDVYLLGVEALAGRLAARAAYYYLRSNSKVAFQRGAADARRTREELTGLARAIEADWQLEPRPGPACASCPYAAYCPAVSPRPRRRPERRRGGQLALELAAADPEVTVHRADQT